MIKKSDIVTILLNELRNSNKFAKVHGHLKYLAEINDFPTLCLDTSPEVKDHRETNVLRNVIDIDVRGYVKSENALNACDELIQDIEEFFLTFEHPSIESTYTITVNSDEGLHEPYGIVTMRLGVQYSNDGYY